MNSVKNMKYRRYYGKILAIIIIAGILAFSYYQYYSLADKLYKNEIKHKGKGYVSDEVWYVSSARNIMLKIFRLKPRITDNKYGVSIVYGKGINRSLLLRIIREKDLDINLVDTHYYKIKVFYIESSKPEDIEKLIEELKKYGNVKDVVWGWRLADAESINTYLNLEHPPLAKYLIILSIYVFGDNPISWRIPFILAGVLTILFTIMASYKLVKNIWVSILTGFFTSIDPIMRVLSSVALLDIYVALFTIISTYFIFSKKYKWALFFTIIGSAFKFNTLFLLIPIWIIFIRRELLKEPSFSMFLYGLSKLFLITITLFISIQMIVSIPLINHIGISSWLDQSIFGAIKWHTSIKCSGSNCPVSSAPWDWFLGLNGFPIYYFTWNNSLVALGFWPFWTIALTYTILFLPLYRWEKRFSYPFIILWGLLFGYIFLWLLGGKTQYSFYAVQFTPITYIVLMNCFTYIVINRSNLVRVISLWNRFLKIVWRTILWLLVIDKRKI